MKTILVADDTKNIRRLLSTCLELEGYKVFTAANGKEALDMFEKYDLDLAFLDIKMPELSGTEVLKTIREKGIQTPVIIITAFATVKNAVECTRMGAVAYLQKPFTADKVKHVLEELEGGLDVISGNMTFQDIEQKVNLLIDGQNYSKAMDFLKKAIALDPKNPKIYLLFSKVYDKTGDIKGSEKFYRMYELIKD